MHFYNNQLNSRLHFSKKSTALASYGIRYKVFKTKLAVVTLTLA
jgi:hypothetical protein